jgi:crossover junction endodeoxyribonuclease RusA
VTNAITFEVRGMNPAPQGSKKYVGKNKNGTAILIETCKQLKEWRDLVRSVAIDLDAPIIEGPVSMSAVFIFERPKSHFNKKGLKFNAPKYMTTRPDRDKLLRAISDALTGVLYKDDSYVVDGNTSKRYCVGDELPGVLITLNFWYLNNDV